MKPAWRPILSAGLVLALCVVWLLSGRSWARTRRATTCQGIKASVADSAQRRFVSERDVVAWMDEYGTYVGAPLDSINLLDMENFLDSKGVVRKSQVWLEDDGFIHVEITQREPVVRFQKGTLGFYADRSGFLFPLQNRFTARVPIVDGALPVHYEPGFKGFPESDADQAWIHSVLTLTDYMGSRAWMDLIGQITVDKRGNLLLLPREGRERFLFGAPTGAEAKFRRIRKYYDTILPSHGEGYTSVDVRYEGQIICR